MWVINHVRCIELTGNAAVIGFRRSRHGVARRKARLGKERRGMVGSKRSRLGTARHGGARLGKERQD